MKKPALTIMALTLSLKVFACWGPEKNGFWYDSVPTASINTVSKAVVSAKSQELKALTPVAISYHNYLVSLIKRLFLAQSNPQ